MFTARWDFVHPLVDCMQMTHWLWIPDCFSKNHLKVVTICRKHLCCWLHPSGLFFQTNKHGRSNSGIISRRNPIIYTEASQKGWEIHVKFLWASILDFKNDCCLMSDTRGPWCNKKNAHPILKYEVLSKATLWKHLDKYTSKGVEGSRTVCSILTN